MSDKSSIEWTDATWNPIVGCSIVSPGCTNCYAMKMAARLDKMLPPERRGECALPHHYAALTKPSKGGPVWTGRVNIAPERIITQPLRWKRGRRVFVNSMGDLFHESIPDEWIDKVFAVMALCPQHTFQVLTKRAERMRAYLSRRDNRECWLGATDSLWRSLNDQQREFIHDFAGTWRVGEQVILPNVWLGASTERQQEADERIPHLLATPAAVRFISAEPLLGPIDLSPYLYIVTRDDAAALECGCSDEPLPFRDPATTRAEDIDTPRLDWVIVGGESGSGARPTHPDWARSLRDQCAAADVPFFFKQWGEYRSWQPGDCGDVKHISARDGRCGLNPGFVEGERSPRSDTTPVARIGKKSAGRLLDGKEHNEIPVARSEASPS